MELPVAFTTSIRALLGDDEAVRFLDALQEEPPVSIRLNEQKTGCVSGASLPDVGTPVPWCASGRYLAQRPAFTFDPLFHAGCYYVQEASSMFLEQALRQYVNESGPMVMLDLCAAPGGKSTLALNLLPPGSLLVANEVIRNRSQVLAENLTKWGCPNVVVTNSDPSAFAVLPPCFDVLLADVPCSGEGMFRKDAVAVGEWSPGNVEMCSQRQRRILTEAWGCLKPGGLLIYSTCTYNTLEDEENAAWICQELGAEALALDVPQSAWGITGNLLSSAFPVYRFLPHKSRGEGFFMALFRKPEEETDACGRSPFLPGGRRKEPKRPASRSAQLPKEAFQQAGFWLLAPDDYEWSLENGQIVAFPKRHQALLSVCKQALRVIQAGIPVGELKGKSLIPHHAISMSLALNRDAFPRYEADYGLAISYLRKEAVSLPSSVPAGFVLLTYRGVPLGFVKNIGNRANNLYPQEWRIRSSHLQEEVRVL